MALLCFFSLISATILLILGIIAAIRKRNKKKYFVSAISCLVVSVISFILFTPETPHSKNINKTSPVMTEKNKPAPKEIEQTVIQEEQKQAEEKQRLEDRKKFDEQFKQEMDKKQQRTSLNTDKDTYENEIKPKIDNMMKEYDEIWNKEWKPAWTEVSNNASLIDKNALIEKMESISNKYDSLSKKNIAFKDGEKLSDPVLKEKINEFRKELGLAINYRSNAATVVNQGLKGVAPMKGRMDEALKSVELSDQKIINAAVNLTEVETKLGISRN
ncbi:ribonuclease [Bacillus paranthracis]|uniref:Ribonuclease n=1 Tax=Bacillus paranthracis TaxID=2026186 RepID=A0AAJ1K1A0_9BACI|nr:ribonuclease [Bacillus paranthracis]MDG0946658.1 ribonuclease [Bacillus paranthracis]MDG0952601.1 ribonuclease [Bacillus paranthracis]